VVEAFLKATREGDLAGLLAVLDPDAVIRIDAAARIDAPPEEIGQPREVRGADAWAPQLLALSRRMRFVQIALIDGGVGLIVAPHGKLARVLKFAFAGGKVARVEVIGDRERLGALAAAVL
jgi:RNA polymerase sigma-70 factor (ECF subfamily)